MEEEVIFKIEIDNKESAAAVKSQVVSIESLTKANKELREERKKLDTQSESGQKRIKEINSQLDANNAKIKENVSALEKQKINIGNYSGALDKLVPGLGATAEGFSGMTKTALQFIATPIGAVIGALGLAIAALTSYFKGSEEGQNRLNKIVAIGAGIFERFMNVIEDVGEFLFDNIVKSLEVAAIAFDKFTTFLGINTDAIKGFFNELNNEAQKFADLQAEIDSKERELIVKRAETNKKVFELREEAIKQEGDAKRATIEEAIALERKLSEEEVKLATLRLQLAQAELDRNGDDKEAKKAVAEATAAVIDAEASRSQATLKFQKELEKLNEEQAKQNEKLREAAELQERILANQQMQIDMSPEVVDSQAAISEAVTKGNEEISMSLVNMKLNTDSLSAGIEKQTKATEANIKATTTAAKADKDRTTGLMILANALGGVAALFEENTIANKVFSAAQAAINSYLAGTQVLRDPTLPTVAKIPAMIAIIGAGLAQQAKIFKAFTDGGYVEGYAGGGLSGTRISAGMGRHIRRSNGDNMIATVRTGEVILNERHQALLGGSETFRRIGVPGFDSSGVTGFTNSIGRMTEANAMGRDLLSAVASIRPVVTVEDINLGQYRVQVVQDMIQTV